MMNSSSWLKRQMHHQKNLIYLIRGLGFQKRMRNYLYKDNSARIYMLFKFYRTAIYGFISFGEGSRVSRKRNDLFVQNPQSFFVLTASSISRCLPHTLLNGYARYSPRSLKDCSPCRQSSYNEVGTFLCLFAQIDSFST